MKNAHFILMVAIILSGCQSNYLTDLTPDTPHRDQYYLDGAALSRAFANIDSVVPDTAYQIAQPEGLFDRSPFTRDRTWWSTDTFAFDPEDFQPVLNLLISTAEDHPVHTSFPTPQLRWEKIAGRVAYSKDKEYILIPYFTKKGERYFIQISRSGIYWYRQRYTAHAIWMQARVKEPKGDVS